MRKSPRGEPNPAPSSERPLWLFLTEPGLAQLLMRELKFIDAVGAKAQAAKLHLRNYDLVVLPEAVVKNSAVAPRLALHVMLCPVFGRTSIGEPQIARLATTCERHKTDGVVAAIAGTTFKSHEIVPWLMRQLLRRGATLGDANAPNRPMWFLAVDEKYYCGFPTFNYHALRKRTDERPGSLPPTIAAAMAFASKLGAEEVVWDPVMGSGTLLSEVAPFGPDAQLIGTDVDAGALTIARKNLADLRNVRLLRATAETVELGGRALTLTIGNLPFGKQYKAMGGNTALYETILRRSLAHAAPSWRGCFLTSDEGAMREALSEFDSIVASKAADVNVRGTDATIWLIARRA